MSKPRLIAFYLPQFYPTKENDEWWEKDFTEWTNVKRGKPLFKGHSQPRVPADLGYYDLRDPQVRERQVELAREAGIEGFCYWHYWFAGRRLLDRVFTEVVESGKPDFPFCLCWANHNWFRKTWDPAMPDKLLIEQTYPGVDDFIAHFHAMLPAFKDSRYMKVNGKLLFGVYDVLGLGKDRFEVFRKTWNDLAVQYGLPGFEFFGFTFKDKEVEDIQKMGYDHVVVDYIKEMFILTSLSRKIWERMKRAITHRPNKVYEYDSYATSLLKTFSQHKDVWPCLVPCFDHSPRSGNRGVILHHSTPDKWKTLCQKVFEVCKGRASDQNVVFIKAWNEWGEGNYMEPDTQFGKGYIQATREALDADEL